MKLSSNLLRNMDDLELLTNLITLDLSNNKVCVKAYIYIYIDIYIYR